MKKNSLKIDHINILAKDFATTIQFYNKIFGLVDGGCFEGGRKKYLYTADQQHALIHLVTDESKIKTNQMTTPGFRVHAVSTAENTGAFDHIAFATDAEDFEIILKVLAAEKIPYATSLDYKQIWLFDPNGIKIEVACEGC